MQSYNPNNPVYKYKSVKAEVPKVNYTEEESEKKDPTSIPSSYGLYLQPTQFKDATMKSSTYLQYVTLTIDSTDRDYTKYPNPFNFMTDRFTEFFKNIKVFQIYYLTVPQFNLVQIPLSQDANYTYMFNFVTANKLTIRNNQLITNGATTYRICNFYNNEVNYLINDNISVVYSINILNTSYNSYGISNSYKLNSNPYLRLNIPEIIYLPIITTDKKQFTYFVRMSRAKNYIAYASVRSPTKVFKEQTLLNISKLTFEFNDSTNQPLSILYLDNNADPVNDPSNFASRYNYVRHPLFYYHQIIMSIRIGVIRQMLK
jgi:hypothetical protein